MSFLMVILISFCYVNTFIILLEKETLKWGDETEFKFIIVNEYLIYNLNSIRIINGNKKDEVPCKVVLLLID